MYGPIDYIVVGFEGNAFDGSIVYELAKATKKGIIRVIDLLFIMKEADGTVYGGEFQDQSDDLKTSFKKLGFDTTTPLLTEDDMEKVSESMMPDTAAGVLVIEHLWAKDLKKAIMAAGGTLVADGRIYPEAVAAAAEELDSADPDTKGGYAHAQ